MCLTAFMDLFPSIFTVSLIQHTLKPLGIAEDTCSL